MEAIPSFVHLSDSLLPVADSSQEVAGPLHPSPLPVQMVLIKGCSFILQRALTVNRDNLKTFLQLEHTYTHTVAVRWLYVTR